MQDKKKQTKLVSLGYVKVDAATKAALDFIREKLGLATNVAAIRSAVLVYYGILVASEIINMPAKKITKNILLDARKKIDDIIASLS